MTATTGVLLRNAEMTAIGIMSRNCAPATVVGRPNNRPMYQSKAPVTEIPCATTNNINTVNRPSLAKPATPSGTVIMEAAMKSVKAVTMTESAPTRSDNKAINMPTKTKQV
eukprot:CAMPEP_0119018666 /NCGR_PEP_ID=MMETSP1176-20130426/19983_1 /TAXON_ID=265551 /ORGANISM="Synedropsis recta cf, Strain CCMP1620" /LENGTH=110 /DNA_ID=CAMNT_0006972715 /DNA_START=64 /DNA_END=396 /DNA_ORIENTATION=-